MSKKTTIEKISRYKNYMIKYYKELWVVNWCWGDWGYKFDKVINYVIHFLEKREGYDSDKWDKLKQDINRVCAEHDIDYFLKKWFFKSNFIFAKNIFLLCKNWTNFVEKSFIFILIFVCLNLFWIRFYIKKNKNLTL